MSLKTLSLLLLGMLIAACAAPQASEQQEMMESGSKKAIASQPTGKAFHAEADFETIKRQAREISAIAEQINKGYNAYNENPRKAFVGTRAKQTSVALWADAWTQKIERTGTYVYPKDAHGNKLRGSLRVMVEINKDGSLLNAQVDRSSGNMDLDQAALRIVRLASPFARLPEDLLDDVGRPATVLVIIRTWSFGPEKINVESARE